VSRRAHHVERAVDDDEAVVDGSFARQHLAGGERFLAQQDREHVGL
jgi:hypothetical protein